ncbi:MAG: lipopolysaccharide biosynthesis protein [Pseudomonadales bacterium]
MTVTQPPASDPKPMEATSGPAAQGSSLMRHSSAYAVGSAVGAALSFFTIPLLTNLLSTDEFGLLELLNQAANIAILIVFVGLRQAFFRIFLEEKTPEWKGRVVGTTLAIILAFGSIAMLVLAAAYPLLERFVFDGKVSVFLYASIVIWMPLEMLFTIGLSHLQAQGQSIKFVAATIIRGVSYLALIFVFLGLLKLNMAYVFISHIVICGIGGVLFLTGFVKSHQLQYDKRVFGQIVRYGAPFLPTAFFAYLLSSSDRWFLVAYQGLEVAGVYSLAFKVGFLGATVLMEPLNRVWSPFAFNVQASADGPQDIGRMFVIYAIASLFGGLALALGADIVIAIVAPGSYQEAANIVPVLAFAAAIFNIACLSDIGLLIAKKTHIKPLIFSTAAATCVLSNWILVPKFGAMGAAFSYLAGVSVLVVVNLSVSNRFYRIRFSYSQALFAGATVLLPFAVKVLCQNQFGMGMVSSLIYAILTALIVAGFWWRVLGVWHTMQRIRF